MKRSFQNRIGAMFVGMLTLVGCQHADRSPSPPPPAQESAKRKEESNLSDSQLADLQIALARSMEAGGENERIFNTYLAAVKRDPNRADACMRLAIHLDKQAKFEDAKVWYDKALTLAPNDADIQANRGYSYYLQHEWELAEKHLRSAIQLKPDHRQARNNLGLLLARRGQVDEALESFRQSGCSTAEARANVAFALAIENQFAESVNQYKLALAADSKCTAARKGLEKLEIIARKAEVAPRDLASQNPSAVPPQPQSNPSEIVRLPAPTLAQVDAGTPLRIDSRPEVVGDQSVRQLP